MALLQNLHETTDNGFTHSWTKLHELKDMNEICTDYQDFSLPVFNDEAFYFPLLFLCKSV